MGNNLWRVPLGALGWFGFRAAKTEGQKSCWVGITVSFRESNGVGVSASRFNQIFIRKHPI